MRSSKKWYKHAYYNQNEPSEVRNVPKPGVGTFLTSDGATCVEAVKATIAAGYSHIDTAAVYKNEKSVGEGIKESGIKREKCLNAII